MTSLEGIELISEPGKVTELDLSNNKLTVVRAKHLKRFTNNLEHLNLSNNQLTNFVTLSSLGELNQNPGFFVPAVMVGIGLWELKKLNVENNKITELNDLDLPSLKKLKAGNNPISTLLNLKLLELEELEMEYDKLNSVFGVGVNIRDIVNRALNIQ